MVRKQPFLVLLLVLACALTICFAAAVVEIVLHGSDVKAYGYWVMYAGDALQVTSVVPGSAADGLLRRGDVITHVDGHGGYPAWLLNRFILLAPAGKGYDVTLQRGHERLNFHVPLPLGKDRVKWTIALQLAAALTCFAAALLIGLIKPGERTIQYASLTFLGLAAIHLARSIQPLYIFMGDGGRFLSACLEAVDPLPIASGYLFASRFPRQAEPGRFWKIIGMLVGLAVFAEWLRLLPWKAFAGMNAVSGAAFFMSLERLMMLAMRVPFGIWKSATCVTLLAMIVAMVRNFRAIPEPGERRRLRWLMFGLVAAILPLILLSAWVSAQYLTGRVANLDNPWYPLAEDVALSWLGVTLALSFAYAVLKHRLLDIHVVLRRGIQYLLTKRVLQAAIFLPLVLIAVRAAINPGMALSQFVFGSATQFGLLLTAALGLTVRRPLLSALDRRFFREEYDQEQILKGLIGDIQRGQSIGEISRLVSQRIEAAFHPSRVLAFYRREERSEFTLEHASGEGCAELRLSAECPVLRALDGANQPRDFSTLNGSVLHHAETALLNELGIRLLAPIASTGQKLLGVLMLGEKKSEEPYTASDRSLLQVIAGQIAVVYENEMLRESARREMRIKRDVLARIEGSQINLLKECPRCGACFDRTEERCVIDGTELALTLPVERVLDGCYRLDQRVGTGGMGAVYRATDLRLDRCVAVKVMTGGLFGNEAALKRFEREARAAARLRHPNIVAIYDFGSIGEDGAYQVMELVEGKTLRTELREMGAMPPALAASRFEQLLAGLAAAHEAGVVHRDLKPENVILSCTAGGSETLKILDFGLAKVTAPMSAESQSLTVVGAVLGTAGYMSPEQLLGEEVDERSDTFAVGVLIVECLTGSKPFSGSSFQDLLSNTLMGEYHLPAGAENVHVLDTLLQRCLAKEKGSRPLVSEIRAELIEAMRSCPTLGTAAPVVADASTIDASRPGY